MDEKYDIPLFNETLVDKYDNMVGMGLPNDGEESSEAEEQYQRYDEFERLMEERPVAAGNLQKEYDRQHSRTPLIAAAQADLCTHLGMSVQILYPLVDDEHPLIPSTEHVDQTTPHQLTWYIACAPSYFLSFPMAEISRFRRDITKQVLEIHDSTRSSLASRQLG